jgi:chemotaxis protein CheZ
MQIADIVSEVTCSTAGINAAESGTDGALTPHDVFVRIGMLTRNLHDTLRQLGYDKGVEQAVGSLPDARARLDYIATLTGKAAERVLDAAERAKSAHDTTCAEAQALQTEWVAALDGGAKVSALKALGQKTRDHFTGAQTRNEQIGGELSEIMLAQDFHDLTGQVIQRVTRLAQSLEEQLVKLLLDASAPSQRREVIETTLAGPVINGSNCEDVVTNQGQVDDLLESLGF